MSRPSLAGPNAIENVAFYFFLLTSLVCGLVTPKFKPQAEASCEGGWLS
jgi:hypothetical protein